MGTWTPCDAGAGHLHGDAVVRNPGVAARTCVARGRGGGIATKTTPRVHVTVGAMWAPVFAYYAA
eukprot:50963-Eustigmatos_ZCMA.PRE.1